MVCTPPSTVPGKLCNSDQTLPSPAGDSIHPELEWSGSRDYFVRSHYHNIVVGSFRGVKCLWFLWSRSQPRKFYSGTPLKRMPFRLGLKTLSIIKGCPLLRRYNPDSHKCMSVLSWVSAVEGCPLRGVPLYPWDFEVSNIIIYSDKTRLDHENFPQRKCPLYGMTYKHELSCRYTSGYIIYYMAGWNNEACYIKPMTTVQLHGCKCIMYIATIGSLAVYN